MVSESWRVQDELLEGRWRGKVHGKLHTKILGLVVKQVYIAKRNVRNRFFSRQHLIDGMKNSKYHCQVLNLSTCASFTRASDLSHFCHVCILFHKYLLSILINWAFKPQKAQALLIQHRVFARPSYITVLETKEVRKHWHRKIA